ncbi:hypothetical protein KM043_009631 [Ampulex compressa]|nr:hypothetical protein KM043_009631 [Ampulex compressa]
MACEKHKTFVNRISCTNFHLINVHSGQRSTKFQYLWNFALARQRDKGFVRRKDGPGHYEGMPKSGNFTRLRGPQVPCPGQRARVEQFAVFIGNLTIYSDQSAGHNGIESMGIAEGGGKHDEGGTGRSWRLGTFDPPKAKIEVTAADEPEPMEAQ